MGKFAMIWCFWCLCVVHYMSHVLRQHSTTHSKLNIVFNIVHKIQNAFSYSIYESCFRELPKHSLMLSISNQFALSLPSSCFVYANSIIMHAVSKSLLCKSQRVCGCQQLSPQNLPTWLIVMAAKLWYDMQWIKINKSTVRSYHICISEWEWTNHAFSSY